MYFSVNFHKSETPNNKHTIKNLACSVLCCVDNYRIHIVSTIKHFS